MEGLASRLLLGTPLSTTPSPHSNAKFLPLKTHNRIHHFQRSSLTTSITVKNHKHFTSIGSFHFQFNKTCCFGFSRFGSNGQLSKEEEEEQKQQKKIVKKTGLFLSWVVLIFLGLQGRFCRPALAAWYWPFGTSATTTQQELDDLVKTYIEEGEVSERKLRKLFKAENRLIEKEKKKYYTKEREESLDQEINEYFLAKSDPQVMESKAKEFTKIIIENFPELEPDTEEFQTKMEGAAPYIGEIDNKKLVDAMYKSTVSLMIKGGDFGRAFVILNRLVEKEPYTVQWLQLRERFLHYAGRKLLEEDHPEEARFYLEEFLKTEPFNPRALQGLAMAMHRLDEDATMIQMLRELVQKAKKIGSKKDVHNMKLLLANAYTVEGNLEEALKQYQRLIDENPKDYKSYLAQGIIYSVLDRKDEAEERFEKYREVVPDGIPHENFLDNVMMEALAEGHKFFEEKKKEEVVAQKEGPEKPVRHSKSFPKTPKSTRNTEDEERYWEPKDEELEGEESYWKPKDEYWKAKFEEWKAKYEKDLKALYEEPKDEEPKDED